MKTLIDIRGRLIILNEKLAEYERQDGELSQQDGQGARGREIQTKIDKTLGEINGLNWVIRK